MASLLSCALADYQQPLDRIVRERERTATSVADGHLRDVRLSGM